MSSASFGLMGAVVMVGVRSAVVSLEVSVSAMAGDVVFWADLDIVNHPWLIGIESIVEKAMFYTPHNTDRRQSSPWMKKKKSLLLSIISLPVIPAGECRIAHGPRHSEDAFRV